MQTACRTKLSGKPKVPNLEEKKAKGNVSQEFASERFMEGEENFAFCTNTKEIGPLGRQHVFQSKTWIVDSGASGRYINAKFHIHKGSTKCIWLVTTAGSQKLKIK